MAVTTFSSREFNQYVSEAKKAAESGPVFITDRGKPALASSTAVENAAAAEYQDKNDDDEQSLGGHAVIVSGRRPDYCRIADSSGQA